MHMIGIPSYDDGLAAQLIASPTQIVVQFLLIGRVDQLLAVFGAEHDVDVVFDERLSHECLVRWAAPIVKRFRPFRATIIKALKGRYIIR